VKVNWTPCMICAGGVPLIVMEPPGGGGGGGDGGDGDGGGDGAAAAVLSALSSPQPAARIRIVRNATNVLPQRKHVEPSSAFTGNPAIVRSSVDRKFCASASRRICP
jgi:hypothetical protein